MVLLMPSREGSIIDKNALRLEGAASSNRDSLSALERS
ncbi:hypothetical protein NJ7G_0570 [Natrinema sp. J7-2]|nr:hypothetical protein NJ7G_0570 [Natrinema sp. J7-2]